MAVYVIKHHADGTSSSAMAERPSRVVSVVCCAYARKVHCAVVGSCYTSGWPCTEHVCVCCEVGVFLRGWVTFGEYLTGKGRCPPITVGVRKLE